MPSMHTNSIPRHIGGLETDKAPANQMFIIPRHIGGLERNDAPTNTPLKLHRHTGGLENQYCLIKLNTIFTATQVA